MCIANINTTKLLLNWQTLDNTALIESNDQPISHRVAKQTETMRSLSLAPSHATDKTAPNNDRGNCDGDMDNKRRTNRSAWIRSISLSKHTSIDLQFTSHRMRTLNIKHETTKQFSDGGGYKGSEWESSYWECTDCGYQKPL